MKPLYRHILLVLSVLCAVVLQFFVTLFSFNDVSSHPLPPPISQTTSLLKLNHLRLPQQQQQLKALPSPSSRSLLSLPPKPTTALVAALDGTMYLVDKQENGPTRVIWSFSTGSPIYHSYQAPIHKESGKENGSTAQISGSVECGDDWSLYMHDKHFGKMKISESIAEYVARTPTFSDDGAVTLGSKRSTLFEVDVKTGRIIQTHSMSDSDNSSASWSDDKESDIDILRTKKKDLANPAELNSPELLLKIFRTDYSLRSVGPSSGVVLWTMTVSEFEAVLLCQHTSFDADGEYVSDSGLSFAMPYPCQEIQPVFRLRKNFILEPSITERLPGSYHENNMPLMPASDLMLPSLENFENLNVDDGNKMVPVPIPNSLPSPEPKIVYPSRMHEWSTPLRFMMLMLLGFVLYNVVVKSKDMTKDQNQSESKISSAKKKKPRKSGKNNVEVDKKEKRLSSEDEDVLMRKDLDVEAGTWMQFNQVDQGVDGRRVGKLLVSYKEIAKGSNGTIVFEGIYEGRAVAVKRLVKTHHDVAFKEIQNLIVSDHHPNIVRWHGVEYDQDFVYLALERCTCSLDDLIQIYSDISDNPLFRKSQSFKSSIKAQIDTGKDNMHGLWKANGYPSPLLLKLMRDVVSGVVHLHELGIIHRDLKPQNVLIIKERSLCAKLSDMGISKRLPEDMSSLGHNATGAGSSGWQAPEQLGQGRQTRAVDLFSLGCVLFFCMTGGRHPFGERLERDVNIVKNRKDLFLVEFIPEAEDLVSSLLNPNPDIRPKAIQVLHHPFFWSPEMRLSFFRDTSDRVELEDRETNSVLLNALESIATVALGAKWDEKLEPAFLNNIGRYRRYKYDSVRDLLRVMRNKLNHYRELPQEIQELVGSVPEGFNEYFASRFPRLLIEVYKVICKHCKEEQCFERYFKKLD